MTPSEVADVQGVLFTATLAIAAALAVASLFSPVVRGMVLRGLDGTGTYLASGLAVLAMAGSLWFSESAGFPPCDLCWYQRIAMYPLGIVLGLAAIRSSATGRITGLVLAGIGLVVSAWHNIIETFPDLDAGSCDPDNPCTIRWVEGLGFWTIPRMAAASFALIIVFCLIDHLAHRYEGASQ